MWILATLSACVGDPVTPPVVSAPIPVPAGAPEPEPLPPLPPALAVFERPEGKRIVAIGDLHGDLANAQATARLAGLVDDQGHWSGGADWFVQTGDVTDRGPDSRDLLLWLEALSAEAQAAGGLVVALNGNHEVMNIQGDWRYVDPADVSRYGGQGPRRKAWAPGGESARWVEARPVVALVGDTVFAHGGVAPRWALQGVDTVNGLARKDWRDDKAEVFGPDGPIWDRVYVEADEAEACPRLTEALAALGARRMVVGHTTRRDGKIQSRCDGRLAVIDIGVAHHYGSHLGFWELVGDDARARYPDQTVDLADPP